MENLPQVQQEGSFFFDLQKFEHAQRISKMFSQSTMVPQHFRDNIGNCMIALNYAARVQADPFMIMQGLYVVHGRPGIESKLAIALLNNSGKFTPLKFKYNKDKTACFATAKDNQSGEVCEGPTVDMEMAKAEGWSSKAGSKWKTLPELMLMYRAAMFFIRMYAPEVLLGMQTREELHDVGPVDMGTATVVTPETDLTAALSAPNETNQTPIKQADPTGMDIYAEIKAYPPDKIKEATAALGMANFTKGMAVEGQQRVLDWLVNNAG